MNSTSDMTTTTSGPTTAGRRRRGSGTLVAGVAIGVFAVVALLFGFTVVSTEDDWGTEYLALEISAAVVPSLDAAIEHIRRHSSAHSDAIVTD